MEENEQLEKIAPPIGLAGFFCAVSLLAAWMIARLVDHFTDVEWLAWFIRIFIPTLAAFTLLYRSAWHRELSVATRILSLLLSACVIYVVVLILFALAVIAAAVFFGNGMVSS